MDGLIKQLEHVKKQREKIKSNISGLYRKIRDIRITKGRTPTTNKYIEGHLKTISKKESKNKDLITKIGEIKDGMKIQYEINKEQRERDREQRKIEREQRERDKEQRKSSRPVLARTVKPKSNQKPSSAPTLSNLLRPSSSNSKPSPARAERPARPALSARDEFKFKMFNLIDSKSAKIETDIDEEMKQTIDRLYKTAIFHIVNDTDYAVLSKKKSIEINGRKANSNKGITAKRGTKEFILDAINVKYKTEFKSFDEFIKHCAGLPKENELKKVNLYNYEKYKQVDDLITLCVDLLIEEIEESTLDETAFREFRDDYLYNIDKNAQRYVSIYDEYIRKKGIDVKNFYSDEKDKKDEKDEEYKAFIKKVFTEKGKYVGSYAYQQYLLHQPNSEYQTRRGYGQDNLHLYPKSENNNLKDTREVRLNENMVGIQLSNSDLKKRLLRLASSLNIDIFISTIKKIEEEIQGKNNANSETKKKMIIEAKQELIVSIKKRIDGYFERLEISDIIKLLKRIEEIYPEVYDEEIKKIKNKIENAIADKKYNYLDGCTRLLTLIPDIEEFQEIRKIIKDKIIAFESLIKELSSYYETVNINLILEFKNRNELSSENRDKVINQVKKTLERYSEKLYLDNYITYGRGIRNKDYDILQSNIDKVDGLIKYNEIISKINQSNSIDNIFNLFLLNDLSNTYLCNLLYNFLILKINENSGIDIKKNYNKLSVHELGKILSQLNSLQIGNDYLSKLIKFNKEQIKEYYQDLLKNEVNQVSNKFNKEIYNEKYKDKTFNNKTLSYDKYTFLYFLLLIKSLDYLQGGLYAFINFKIKSVFTNDDYTNLRIETIAVGGENGKKNNPFSKKAQKRMRQQAIQESQKVKKENKKRESKKNNSVNIQRYDKFYNIVECENCDIDITNIFSEFINRLNGFFDGNEMYKMEMFEIVIIFYYTCKDIFDLIEDMNTFVKFMKKLEKGIDFPNPTPSMLKISDKYDFKYLLYNILSITIDNHSENNQSGGDNNNESLPDQTESNNFNIGNLQKGIQENIKENPNLFVKSKNLGFTEVKTRRKNKSKRISRENILTGNILTENNNNQGQVSSRSEIIQLKQKYNKILNKYTHHKSSALYFPEWLRAYAINICIIYIGEEPSNSNNKIIIQTLYEKLSELNIDITQFKGININANLSNAEYRALLGFNREHFPNKNKNKNTKQIIRDINEVSVFEQSRNQFIKQQEERLKEIKYNQNNDFSIKRIYKGMLNNNEKEKLRESEESLVNMVKKKNSSEINNSNIKKYINQLKKKAKTNINEYKKELENEKQKKRKINENFERQQKNKSLMNTGAYINRLLSQENYEYSEQDINNMEDLKNRFFENKTIETQEQKNKYNKLLLFIKRQKKKLQEKREKEKLNKLTTNINNQTKRVGNEKENIEKLLNDIDDNNTKITEKIQKINDMKNGSEKLDRWIDSELTKLQNKINEINNKIDELKLKYNTKKSKNIEEKVSFQLLNKKRVLKGGISSENLNIISLRYNILQELNELIKDIENILTIDIVQIIKEIENIKRYEKFVKDKDDLDYDKIIVEVAIAVVIHLFTILDSRNYIENNFASGEIKKIIEKYKEYMISTESEFDNLSLSLSYITNYVLFYVIYFSLYNANNTTNRNTIFFRSQSKTLSNKIFSDPTLTKLTITTTTSKHVTDPKQKGGLNDKQQILQIVNKCSKFSKEQKSEDYNSILSNIKKNKYLYDLLLFLYLKLFKAIISIRTSNKQIKIDYLPSNYQKIDIYFNKINIKFDDVKSDIDTSIENNIKKIKYISRNNKQIVELKYKVGKIRYHLPDDPNIELIVDEDESTLIPLVDSSHKNKSVLERITEKMKGPVLSYTQNSKGNRVVQVKKTKEELKKEVIEKMIADINLKYASLDTLIKKAGKSIFLQNKSNIYKDLLKKYSKMIEETQRLYKSIEEKIENIKKLQSQIPKINKNNLSLDEYYKQVKDKHYHILRNYQELNGYITKIENIQQQYKKEIKEKEAQIKKLQGEINLLNQSIYITIDGKRRENPKLNQSVLKERKERISALKKQLNQLLNKENAMNNTQATATSSSSASSGYNYMNKGSKEPSRTVAFNDEESEQSNKEKENKIKKILEQKNKDGITIKEKISIIFNKLSEYGILFSEDINSFMKSFLTNRISLLNLNTNISKLIKELTIIINVFNDKSNITGINSNRLKELKNKVGKFNKTTTNILIKCLNELKELGKKPEASQGQANEEIIIKTVLGTPNKTGKTIEKQFEHIFTELAQYNDLLSKNTRDFMGSASSGLVSLSVYSTNIEKLIDELNKIISVLNGNNTNKKLNKKLKQKLTEYNLTKSTVITKLTKCKDELTKLNKKYKDFMIIYSKSHPTVFKEFQESSNKQTKKKILDEIQAEFIGFLSRIDA